MRTELQTHSTQGFRALSAQELLAVGGGLYVVDEWGSVGAGGDYQVAGLWDVVVKTAEVIGVIQAAAAIWDYAGLPTPGVAGSGANENDNGGTSYGTGVCNTWGC